MRSSSFFRLLAISAAIGAAGTSAAQRPGGVATAAPAPSGAPRAIAPDSDHPVARRAAELMRVIGTGASQEAKRSFAASAWQRGEGETIEAAIQNLELLAFYLGKDARIKTINLNPEGLAAVAVVNAYGRESIVNLAIEAGAPHRISVAGLERSPLEVPKNLREPKSVSLASRIVEAPLTFIGGRPMVDVMIGDKGPYRFMLETGANIVTISPQVAAATLDKLRPLTPDLMWRAEGQELGSTYMIEELRIGGATLRQLGVMVTPKRPGEDGTLGLPAYRNLLLGLDLANKRMTLQEGSLPPPDGREVFPIRPLGPLWSVDLAMGEKTVPFEIDTQADGSLFLASELATDWQFDEELVRVGTVVTGGGQHRAPSMLGRLSGDLRLGRYILKKPLITVRADPEDTIPPSGLLGVGVLRHFTMTLDQKNRRVRFTRPGSAVIASPPPYRTLDFNIFAGRDGKPKIVDLAPEGAAARAGLKEGDVVVSFANIPGKEAAEKVRTLAQTADPIVLEVLRGEQPLRVTVQSQVRVK